MCIRDRLIGKPLAAADAGERVVQPLELRERRLADQAQHMLLGVLGCDLEDVYKRQPHIYVARNRLRIFLEASAFFSYNISSTYVNEVARDAGKPWFLSAMVKTDIWLSLITCVIMY